MILHNIALCVLLLLLLLLLYIVKMLIESFSNEGYAALNDAQLHFENSIGRFMDVSTRKRRKSR